MAGRNMTLAKDAAPMLRQVLVSVAATIIATATLTAVQHQYAAWQASTAPSLTSGGKFAARLESMADVDRDATPAAFATPRLPVLLSMPLPQPRLAGIELAAAPVAIEPTRPVRRAARAESRPHATLSASAEVVPPRRTDILAEAAPAEASSDDMSLWRTTKTLAHQALGLGDAVWARIAPTQWMP